MNDNYLVLNHEIIQNNVFHFTKFYISMEFADNLDQLRRVKSLNKIDHLFVNQLYCK
jgi:hypothetical protein